MAHVQNVATLTGTSSGTSVTFPAFTAIGSGNCIVGWLLMHNATNIVSNIQVGSTNAIVLTADFIDPSGSTYSCIPFVLFNITGGPTTITVHFTGTPTNTDHYVGFDEFSGQLALDTSSAAVANTAATSLGTSITTTTNGSTLWTAQLFASTAVRPSGYTAGQNTGTQDTAYATQTTAGPTTATWTFASSTPVYVCLVALVATLPTAGVATYYVDNSVGNDTYNGTSPTFTGGSNGPWATVGHVNSQQYSGGTTILFQGGQSFTDAPINMNAVNNWGASPAPSSSAPITFGSFGTGQATISSGSLIGFQGTNIFGLVVQNLTFTGGGNATTTVDGIYLVNNQASNTKLAYIRLTNLTVSGYGKNGIQVDGTNGTSGFNDGVISECVVHDCTLGYNGIEATGILIYSLAGYNANVQTGSNATAHTNWRITGCTVHDCAGSSTTGQANWTGSGIFMLQVSGSGLTDSDGNAKGAIIDHSIVYNCGTNSGATFDAVAIWFANVFDGTIEYNEMYNNGNITNMCDGGDLDAGCYRSTMQRNYVHGNFGSGLMLFCYHDTQVNTNDHCTIRYNILQTNGFAGGNIMELGFGTSASSAITNGNIYNNTVYCSRTGVTALWVFGPNLASCSGRINNNILYSTGTLNNVTAVGNPTTVVFDGNDYFSSGTLNISWNSTNYTTISSWKAFATAQETVNGGFSTDPLLVSPGGGGTTNGYNPGSLGAYRLQSGSSMFGAGLDMNAHFSINPGTHDYYGDNIPAGAGTGFPVGAAGVNNLSHNLPLLGVGNMIGWRAALPLAAAWKLGKALAKNGIITRRRLLLPK